ncbi:MAG TPA: protein translocase subunit SecF [Gemmatimonadaceae bacterium]|nr:protein translocase subunit SecF [Gemmatimonadaceae bacterium]
MIRLFHGTHYDFIRWWRWAAGLTIAFIVIGLTSFAIKRPNFSIEFTGGTLMQLQFAKPVDVAQLRGYLDEAGIHGAEIQQFGNSREFTIRAQETAQSESGTAGAATVATQIRNLLVQRYGADGVRVARTEGVGPRVGNELRRDAVIAMLLSFLVTTVYLAIRFEWRFGIAALIATGHDVFTTLAFLKIMHLEISLTVVAAILTVIGYSLNDTIIIFDRVRENLRKNRKEPLYDTLNRSINETLPRSILTHATTFAAVLALLFFAGEVIRPFAWVMAFGILTGTFSSIYVASPVLLWIENKWPRRTSAFQTSSTATRTSPTRRSPATAAR